MIRSNDAKDSTSTCRVGETGKGKEPAEEKGRVDQGRRSALVKEPDAKEQAL